MRGTGHEAEASPYYQSMAEISDRRIPLKTDRSCAEHSYAAGLRRNTDVKRNFSPLRGEEMALSEAYTTAGREKSSSQESIISYQNFFEDTCEEGQCGAEDEEEWDYLDDG